MKHIFTTILTLAVTLFAATQPITENLASTEARYFPFEKTIFYKLGEKSIPLKVVQYGPSNDILCINLHDNEFTSVEAARSVLELKGGTLVKIENNAQRVIRFRLRGLVYGFDPNRIFSRTGIEQTLRENGRISPQAIDEVERFAQRLLELIPETASCVIALHNNTEEAFSVKSYLPGGDRQSDAVEVHPKEDQDVDDIALTTDRTLFETMSSLGYNSILQDNEKVKRDGSLSVYFGEKNRKYVNIETQHGRMSQYQEMLGKLLDFLNSRKLPVPANTEGTF